MSKAKTIRPLDGFTGVPDADVVSRGIALHTGMIYGPCRRKSLTGLLRPFR